MKYINKVLLSLLLLSVAVPGMSIKAVNPDSNNNSSNQNNNQKVDESRDSNKKESVSLLNNILGLFNSNSESNWLTKNNGKNAKRSALVLGGVALVAATYYKQSSSSSSVSNSKSKEEILEILRVAQLKARDIYAELIEKSSEYLDKQLCEKITEWGKYAGLDQLAELDKSMLDVISDMLPEKQQKLFKKLRAVVAIIKAQEDLLKLLDDSSEEPLVASSSRTSQQ